MVMVGMLKSKLVDNQENKRALEVVAKEEAVEVEAANSGVMPLEMLVVVAEEDNSIKDLALLTRLMAKATNMLIKSE